MNRPANRPSLRARLLTTIFTMVVAVWTIALVASYVQARHELDELLDAHLTTSAALLIA